MMSGPNASVIASFVSEPSRAAMLTLLMDGRYHTAGELACAAGVKAQTASYHLSMMVDGGVLDTKKQGRHRYFGIVNAQVAGIMELLLSAAPRLPVRSLRQAEEDAAIRHARTCYDHLAGRTGVLLTEAMVRLGVLLEDEEDYRVTDKGESFFASLGIDLELARRKRRSFARQCLDWSERKPHLGGALGQVVLARLIELAWIERSAHTRAVVVTRQGKMNLEKFFSVTL
ncbi:winged helix-turn-helix domain-containing protein [Paenibacillus sp. JX-17]|uniref:Winged helix-turn-helix domain-containing protein n=1 Tax=Paenibacillus lacisoli TaxID=3064525 RepID=A0ABT9C8I4_9BACL|nr:winged helix-turn-helix domain-containing protein [Paenibacillus sp. JX-17]MDO7905554.1 winged helix-turn-helix domain-containing protein [Paenibacillus sp. JX-17]